MAGFGPGDIADGILRRIEDAQAATSAALFEPVIRLGVTGLSRAGKTVFITSLVANLLDRGRMPGLRAASQGRIQAVMLQPQPDQTVPRFDYERHLACLGGENPTWPVSTRQISQLRLSFRVMPVGLLAGLTGPRIVHLDIVDYPGEWLLDLPLMDLSFGDWSAAVLARAGEEKRAAIAAEFLGAVQGTDPAKGFEEPDAQALAGVFRAYLNALRDAGLSGEGPGRMLLPGDLEGSPALTFAPLPVPASRVRRPSLYREMDRRFEAYKSQIIRPFFRDHFARIDEQIVLIDVLGAIHRGPDALDDLRGAMAQVLAAFRPGRNSWLGALLGRRVERILFAATKADYLHHSQHPRLTAIAQALVRDASDRADFAGARTGAIAIAALRATVEETRKVNGRDLDCVRGRLADTGKLAVMYAGDLPEDPAALLARAREGGQDWLNADYGIMALAPARLTLKPGEGPPHIRLDQAAEFLLGDRL